MRYVRITIVLLPLFFLALVLVPIGYSQDSSILKIAYTQKDIATDPFADVWNDATPIIIELTDQEITEPFGGKHLPIEVRGLHNGKSIGFLIEWADSTRDTKVTGNAFTDGAALQFPINLKEETDPFMGGPGLVNIWFWRADWQGDLDDGTEYLDTKHPPYPGYYFPQDKQVFLKEIKGGRLIKDSPVEDLVAQGFGTLERQKQQDVAGKGVYEKGKWRAAFVRPLVTNDQLDTQFKPGMDSKINFSVWDGADKNRDGEKSVSIDWVDVKIEDTK